MWIVVDGNCNGDEVVRKKIILGGNFPGSNCQGGNYLGTTVRWTVIEGWIAPEPLKFKLNSSRTESREKAN